MKLMCCEVQHKHWPCLGRCSGQLACGDPPAGWFELGVLRDAARTTCLALGKALFCGHDEQHECGCRWHCWNAAVSFAQYVRCLVCFSLLAAALSSDSEAGDSVPWHRTYRYWSKPETGHHCLWSSLLSNKSAVALKSVIACLGTGLIGGEASLRKRTTAPGPLFLQIVRMGGGR